MHSIAEAASSSLRNCVRDQGLYRHREYFFIKMKNNPNRQMHGTQYRISNIVPQTALY